MNLRSSSVFKIFILLLSIEFLDPALMGGVAFVQSKDSEHMVAPCNHHPLFSFFTSEMNESKEGWEDRDTLPFIPIIFSSSFLFLPKSEPISCSFAPARQQFDVSPPLYKLHCVFLI
jgi:hypothetical protein